jgi:hypothetical protein
MMKHPPSHIEIFHRRTPIPSSSTFKASKYKNGERKQIFQQRLGVLAQNQHTNRSI